MSDLSVTSTQLPAHIAAMFGPVSNEDLTAGVSGGYPILSYRGKSWALVQGGSREVIIDDRTGDPRQSLEVVVVKANPHISKIYYPDGYEEGSTDKPLCYSNDSVAPGLDAEEPQAVKCGICVHNQWGSRITENGAKGKACSDLRRLAVVPAQDLDTPMLLRVPAASLRGLVDYANALMKRQVPYQALVTKIGFDPEAAYPKMVFTPLRWLDEVEAAKVLEQMGSDVVAQITTLNMVNMDQEAGVAPAAVDPLAGLGPRPGAAQASAPVAPVATAVRRSGRPPKAAVAPADVAQAMAPVEAVAAPQVASTKSSAFGGGGPAPAPVAVTPPTQAQPRENVLVAEATAGLDSILGDLGLDDEDPEEG